jgi:hypothetical protein
LRKYIAESTLCTVGQNTSVTGLSLAHLTTHARMDD